MSVISLTSAQRRIWFAEQFRDVGATYVLDASLRLAGPLDTTALETAVGQLVDRHPALRLRVSAGEDGMPRQWISSDPVRLRYLRARGATLDERREDGEALLRTEVTRPMDVGRGPVFTPALIEVAAGEHLLALPYHHLAGDGESHRVLRADLLALYESARTGTPADLPSGVVPYAEIVTGAESDAARSAREAALAGARERLAGAPAESTVPADRPRPTRLGPDAHVVRCDLDEKLAAALSSFARTRRVTPFIVCSAALHLLLQRYSRQAETLAGFMTAGRTAAQRRAVGLYSQTVVQRLASEPGDTVGGMLRRLRADVLAANEQRQAPLEDLVEALGQSGVSGRHPLFQAMLNMVDPGPDLVRGGLTATPVAEPAPLAWLDLEFRLHPRPDGTIEGWLRAPAGLYDRATVGRVARHFVNLVAALVAAEPEAPIAGLDMLDPAERAAVLAAGEGAARRIEGSLTARLRAALRRYPERPALTYDGVTLTYAELADRAYALAGRLASDGIGPGSLVAVSLPRGIELVVALVGIAVAGAAYVPIDPDEPAARREFMLGDLRPAAVIDADTDIFATGREAELAPDPAEDDLAYVIYTSGSTGAPKAAGNTQLALVNRIAWMQDDHRLGAGDAVLQKTPFTFDVSVWEFYWPLLAGARLVVARPGGHRDPAYLARIIRDEAVTTVHFVPSMLRAFIGAGELTRDLPLRRVLCSGEALPPRLAEEFLAASGAELHNLYGPTEAAIDVTCHRCEPGQGPVMPIGRAVPNTRVLVLDGRGEPVPFGGVGELHLGGIQLARGYLNRPQLTAQRFVPDPHRPGERLYRTGDLGRMRPDGVIEYLGRTDRQVKLRGLRIEPGEIEAVVEAVPGIGQGVVDVIGDALVAFAASGTVTREGLVAALATRLPAQLLPARVHVLPELPLSRNGKVDHRALAALDNADATHDAQAPHAAGDGGDADRAGQCATPAEKRLLDVIRAVLGRPATRVTDSFFAVGGDSIRSIELVARARTAGIALSVEQIFSHPSARQLAAVARTATAEPEQLGVAPFALLDAAARDRLPRGVTDAYPLSATLAGLLVESSQPDRYRVYTTSLRLHGDLDHAALEAALAVVLRRHPFLRSAIEPAPPDGAEPCQLVYAEVPAAVAVHDLRDLAPEERDREVVAWLEREATIGFDWTRPPLLRLTAHRLAEHEFQLTLAEPYLDGFSAALVLTELLTGYQRPGSVPPDEVRGYADYLAEQREATERSAGFWRGQLDGAPDCHVPGLDAGSGEAVTLSYVDVQFPPDVSAALTALNRATGVPLKSILLAAHVRAVAAATGRDDVVTGLMANARPATADGAAVVGLFLNANLLRVRVAPGTWWELVEGVQRAEAATLPHRGYPLAHLRRDRLADGVGTLFNFTHFHPYDRIAASGGLRVLDRVANDQTYFPLTAQFQLDPLRGTLALRLEFFGADLTAPGRAAVAALFSGAVTEIARAPHARHDGTALGGDPSVLTGPPEPPFEALHRTFAATAARHPDRIATRGGWTFAELDERSARVAAALRRAGLRAGEPVGVCRARDPWLVASVLGTLRAGGVYLPLDPALPPERRAAMVAAAGCRIVLDETPHPRTIRPETIRPETLPAVDGSAPDFDAGPDHPAYLIFTSGSTGEPKGVLVPHRAVANRLAWGRRRTPFSADDVLAARTPIAFVDSVAELLAGPLAGAATQLVPDAAQDPAALVAYLADAGATRVTTVPTMLAEVLRLDGDLSARLSRLRHWTVSGEALPVTLAREFRRRLPAVRLFNLYGSTEVAADATAYEVGSDERGAAVPIGKPIAGATATVADPWGNPVPRLITGQLVIGGAPVGSGYLDGSPGGFTGDAFRTGDLARVNAAGELEYRGRADRQLKIRGVRLEPAEVESALRAVHGVRAAVVTAAPRYVAHLVLDPGTAEPQPRTLRQELRRRLPAAAIPDEFAVLDRLPLTVTGKVDRSGLAGLGRPLRAVSGGTPPATLVERELAVLWQDRLGGSPVGRHDDFFDAGGHSLQALLLIGAARQRLGVELTLADLFDHPTLAEQAELIEERLVEEALVEEAAGSAG